MWGLGFSIFRIPQRGYIGDDAGFLVQGLLRGMLGVQTMAHMNYSQ